MDKKQINIKISVSELVRIDLIKRSTGRSMQDLCEQWILDGISRECKKNSVKKLADTLPNGGGVSEIRRRLMPNGQRGRVGRAPAFDFDDD